MIHATRRSCRSSGCSLVVLISGGGTTLVNLCRRIAAGSLKAQIPLVISSRPEAGGIQRARQHGLEVAVCHRKEFSSTSSHSEAISTMPVASSDLVICGGFLSLLEVPEDFRNRVLNIHPSLIPAFCGKGFYGHHVHEAAIQRVVSSSRDVQSTSSIMSMITAQSFSSGLSPFCRMIHPMP